MPVGTRALLSSSNVFASEFEVVAVMASAYITGVSTKEWTSRSSSWGRPKNWLARGPCAGPSRISNLKDHSGEASVVELEMVPGIFPL